jgi:exopolysaccharide production protein ExoZ
MSKELHYIVFLRAIACLLVVFAHSVIYVKSLAVFPNQFEIKYFLMYFGAIGVDIFFVLSGFILLFANDNSKKTVLIFFIGRLMRIYPAYFVVLLITLIIGVLKTYSGKAYYEVDAVFESLFLYTSISADGHASNPIGVAWTLSYEIYFYILLGISWKLSALKKTVVITLMFYLANEICLKFYPENNFLSNSIVYEFSLGMIGYLFFKSVRLSGVLAVILCILSISWILVLYNIGWQGYEEKLVAYRWIILGFPSVFLLLGLMYMPSLKINKYISNIGVGSYSIYLTHFTISLPLIGIASRSVHYFMPHDNLPIQWVWPLIFICAFFSCCVGFVFYIYIESPFSRIRILGV